jgi:hypothetical protein
MASLFSDLLSSVRFKLVESTAKFWTDAELYDIMFQGARDLWRSVVDLKQEHYLTIDVTNVSMAANSTSLTGVPADVHKIYMIEPRDLTINGANHGLSFKPLEYNSDLFQMARASQAMDPGNGVIYYAIMSQGAPVGAPTIKVAPQVTSAVDLAFSYCPVLGTLTSASNVPVPGEANNAIVSWTVAFARAKEREDRSPDPAWLSIYATDKQSLLQGLGLREYQDPLYTEAIWESYWGVFLAAGLALPWLI